MALLLAGGVLSACDRQSGPQGQHANAAAAATSDEVPSSDEATSSAGNESGGFSFSIDRSKAGTATPAFVFAAPGGKESKLADFAGKPILVNLWATWCAPCVAEMPTLDAIAATYAPQGLQILTISQDSQGAERVDAFFAAKKFKHLKAWRDPENQFGFHYATGLLPTSVLYDAKGKEVARVTGAMDWTGPEAKALIEDALKGA
jgi:thiol-disulfide isomerase/thioredoxin